MMIFDIVVTMLLIYKSFIKNFICFIIQKVIYRKISNIGNKTSQTPIKSRVLDVTNGFIRLVTGDRK